MFQFREGFIKKKKNGVGFLQPPSFYLLTPIGVQKAIFLVFFACFEKAIFDEKTSINSFEQLLEVCNQNKEIKLKYELEKNVNLVNFEKNRIEISFNEDLDKNFVKDLSLKLYEWTSDRWIITLSKSKGEISIKDKQQNLKNELLKKAKNSEIYKEVLKKFYDANLVDFKSNKKSED